MRIILLQHVPKVGKKYDIVSVADGYAKNFLLRKGLGELALPKRIAELEKKRAEVQSADDLHLKQQAEALQALNKISLTILVKADDAGHLYKKVHAQDIVALLEKERGLVLAPEALVLDEALHSTGEYEVAVEDVAGKATFTLVVARE